MCRTIRLMAIFFVLAASAAAQAYEVSPEEKQAIAGISREIAAAIQKKDRKALEALYAVDYVHVHAIGAIDDRKKRLDQLLTGEPTIDTPTQWDVGLRKYGETILGVGRVTIAGEDGKPVTYAVTRVYVKEKGRWTYASSHASLVVPK